MNLGAAESGRNPDYQVKAMRQSIEPTYDSRAVGNQYHVRTYIQGQELSHQRIADPFVRATVTIGWRDLLRHVFGRELSLLELNPTRSIQWINRACVRPISNGAGRRRIELSFRTGRPPKSPRSDSDWI